MNFNKTDDNSDQEKFITRIIQNTLWFFNSSLVVRFLNLAKNIILARLLLPDDFGVFGLALIIIGFAELFSNVGAGASLIYKHDSTDTRQADTVFWVNLIISTMLAALVAIMAPQVAKFYGRLDLIPVLIVLAISLWFQTGSNVHRNFILSKLRFRSIPVIDAFVGIITFISAIALALKGYGVWSLVLSNLIGNFINAVLICCVSGWLPKLHFSLSSLKILIPFSGYYFGAAIVWYFVLTMDNLLVGKFLDMKSLGFYTIAYNYSLLPVTIIANSLGNVSIPELARIYNNPDQFWQAFYQVSTLLVKTVTPIACAILVSAQDFFPVIFGPKWNEAIIPFQILTVYGIVRCLWADPFSSTGNFKMKLWLGLITGILGVVGILLGLKYGITGVAIAVLVIVGSSHVIALYIVSRSIKRLFQGFINAFPSFITGIFSVSIVLIGRSLFIRSVGEIKIALFILEVVAIFIVFSLVFYKDIYNFLKTIAGNKSIREIC